VIALGFVSMAILGATVRWRAVQAFGEIGTAAVNVLGAFALGLIAAQQGDTATLIGTAGLGSLTTVSGWVNELNAMCLAGRRFGAALHLIGTLGAGIAAAWTGLRLG
jgi:CrcB protein